MLAPQTNAQHMANTLWSLAKRREEPSATQCGSMQPTLKRHVVARSIFIAGTAGLYAADPGGTVNASPPSSSSGV